MRQHHSFQMLLSVVLVLGFSILGCPPEDTSKIKIGVVGPFTGEGATYGESMRRGFELALEDQPDIQLIYEDSKLSAREGVSAINKLIFTDNVKVVLGAAASSVSLAMVPVADRNKVVLFSSISTADELKTASDYFFRNVPRNEVQGYTAARFAIENLGLKKIAIYKKNDDYGTNLSHSFKYEAQRLGGEILYEDAYPPRATDFRTVILKLKAIAPEVVYIPGNYQEIALFLKQCFELEFRPVFIGGDGSYSPELINIAANAAEETYYTLMAVDEDGEYYLSFKDKFTKRYNREPDVYDAYAYEAAMIISQAISAVGYDADKIVDYLIKTEFDSLTGKLTFDYYGEVNRLYGIVKVENGKFVEVK